ncbi:MAG: OsmC family protein [Deinococcales bacterium]|nr:OsmC family protein [Chitinophagaceae bacterium]
MPTIELNRVQNDYGFEAKDENGHLVKMDTSPESGGQNFGVRPMQMLLMGLGGCSAIDVLMILKKQRQTVRDYKMIIKGDRDEGKEPSLWKDITVEFHIYGDVDVEKAEKAVDLSLNKYCSVAATLMGSGTNITTATFVHK